MNGKYSVFQIILVSIAVIILSLLYFFYPATNKSFYPSCPFHTLTGLYCPGCGSQRAVSSLLHGHPVTAMNQNLLLVIILPFIIYSAVVFTWNAFSKNKIKQPVFYSPIVVKIILIGVIAFAVLRNIPISPFLWLAP